MRLAVLDNTNNNGYTAVKALRRLGAEADLLLDPADTFVMSDPRWEELELRLASGGLWNAALPEVALPPWVRSFPGRAAPHGRRAALATVVAEPRLAARALRVAGMHGLAVLTEHAPVVRRLREYDCALAFGIGPALCALADVPCIAHTWGGDITLIPFFDEQPDAAPWRVAQARLQRWGYASAHRILLSEPRYLDAAERLGLAHKSHFSPRLIDTTMYTPKEDRAFRRELLDGDGGDERIVFVPSRQDWRWKGSDLMLRGFARLERRAGVRLVCAGWGEDLERSRALAGELDILDRVRFLPYAMSKPLLLRCYRAADVVMDQFTLHSLGASALQAMSCARPLVTSLDVAAFREAFGEEPPVRESRTAEQIGAGLIELVSAPERARELGRRARAFVCRHYGDHLARQVLELCREAAA